MVGTLYFANGTTYYVSDSGAAKFNTLEAASTLTVTGATTLNSTLSVTGDTTINGTAYLKGQTLSLSVSGISIMRSILPAEDNISTLGSGSEQSPKRWLAVFIGDANTYGSATQPIWWSNGIPTPCTSYANASVATAVKFTSAQTIALTGDTIGSVASQAGWSIATTTYHISAQPDSVTYRAENTAPFSDLYKRHITFDGLKNNVNIDAPTTGVTYSHVMTIGGWSDDSGGPMHQLAFNTNCIAFRRSSSATAWGDWFNIVHSTKSTAVGSATQPIWIDSNGKATPCSTVEVPTVFKMSFVLESGVVAKQFSREKITADMHVINLVVTSGDEGLHSPIAWGTAAGSLTLQCDSAVTADVHGYVYLAKVADL